MKKNLKILFNFIYLLNNSQINKYEIIQLKSIVLFNN